MKRLSIIIICIITSLLLFGCGTQELEKENAILKEENIKLKEELKTLSERITELENSPENIYKTIIEDFEANKKIAGTIEKLEELINKYPTSSIVEAAKKRIEEIKLNDKTTYDKALSDANKAKTTEEKKRSNYGFQ